MKLKQLRPWLLQSLWVFSCFTACCPFAGVAGLVSGETSDLKHPPQTTFSATASKATGGKKDPDPKASSLTQPRPAPG